VHRCPFLKISLCLILHASINNCKCGFPSCFVVDCHPSTELVWAWDWTHDYLVQLLYSWLLIVEFLYDFWISVGLCSIHLLYHIEIINCYVCIFLWHFLKRCVVVFFSMSSLYRDLLLYSFKFLFSFLSCCTPMISVISFASIWLVWTFLYCTRCCWCFCGYFLCLSRCC